MTGRSSRVVIPFNTDRCILSSHRQKDQSITAHYSHVAREQPHDSLARFLVPEPDSEDEAHIIDNSVFVASEIRRLTEFTVIGNADVRCDFATELVTQA